MCVLWVVVVSSCLWDSNWLGWVMLVRKLHDTYAHTLQTIATFRPSNLKTMKML